MDGDDFPDDGGTARRLNVLYLVSELERAVRMGGIAWDVEDADRIPGRLTDLASALRRRMGN